MTWLTATLPRFGPSQRANIPYFAVGVILDLAGIPTVCDIGLSLYSKLLPSNMQVGRCGGILRSYVVYVYNIPKLRKTSVISETFFHFTTSDRAILSLLLKCL